MGYFGSGAFDNDDARDWLASAKGKLSSATLSRPLSKYEKFAREGPGTSERMTREQIERVVAGQISFWRQDPPPNWEKEAKTLEEWLQREESRKRDYYSSGQYLDREYGPVEAALAAAELIASLSGNPGNGLPDEVDSMLQSNAMLIPSTALIKRAAVVVKEILSNDRYRRMRAAFLNAFPEASGGDDEMRSIESLLKRLQSAERARG